MKKYFVFLVCFYCVAVTPLALQAWECDVTVDGPNTIKLNQQITLTATGTPAGGSYSWSRTPNLTPNGSTATLTGFQPTFSEYIRVVGYYTSPKGKKCSDTKWLWACVCSLTQIVGPPTAKVGEEITLTTQADPEGGTYSWSIITGTGTLAPTENSVKFIGDQPGAVEIKASYVPPEGGEPCTKFHSIEIIEECDVTLTGDMYQRPICQPVQFHAEVEPVPGECSWNASSDYTQDVCNAIYQGTVPGYDTLTATYTRPGGTTCEDSKSILSYELVDNMTPKKACFISGSTIEFTDFNLTTTPPGFENNAIFSPLSVSTLSKKEEQNISASLLCDTNPNTVSTDITVVNENRTTGFGLEVEIPNLIKTPLKFLGIAEKFEFKLENSYEQGVKCCTDAAKDYTKGKTSVDASVDLKGVTIYGVPLPKTIKKYFTLDALKVDLKGETGVSVSGEYKPCESIEEWSGGGSLAVKLDAGAEAKIKAPYVLIQGEIKGGTDISETLNVNTGHIVAKGNWGGVNVSGKVIVRITDFKIKPFEIKHPLLKGAATPVFTINLPSLL